MSVIQSTVVYNCNARCRQNQSKARSALLGGRGVLLECLLVRPYLELCVVVGNKNFSLLQALYNIPALLQYYGANVPYRPKQAGCLPNLLQPSRVFRASTMQASAARSAQLPTHALYFEESDRMSAAVKLWIVPPCSTCEAFARPARR